MLAASRLCGRAPHRPRRFAHPATMITAFAHQTATATPAMARYAARPAKRRRPEGPVRTSAADFARVASVIGFSVRRDHAWDHKVQAGEEHADLGVVTWGKRDACVPGRPGHPGDLCEGPCQRVTDLRIDHLTGFCGGPGAGRAGNLAR